MDDSTFGILIGWDEASEEGDTSAVICSRCKTVLEDIDGSGMCPVCQDNEYDDSINEDDDEIIRK